MPKFSTTHRVDFTPQQIFAVVADVGSYKEFLPLVERSTVRNRKPAVDGNENFGADLLVGYKKMGIQETFSSQVQTSLKDLTVNDGLDRECGQETYFFLADRGGWRRQVRYYLCRGLRNEKPHAANADEGHV